MGVWRVSASPTSALCQPTSWIERNAARSQFVHGEPVPPGAGQGADHAQPDEDAAPEEQLVGLALDDALVDGPAHRGGEEGLA